MTPENFDALIEKIRAHPTYGPAVADVAARKASLILNYHTHGPGHGYCVSLAELTGLPVFGQPPQLKELAHIRGVAREESQCLPLMNLFAQRLQRAYQMETLPSIALNGRAV
jgi:hypothetical protein